MNRIELITGRIKVLREALATDSELEAIRQFGEPAVFAQLEALNASILAAIATHEAELAELMAVQGDPLASAWLEYRKARQAYAEATRTRGGFSSEPKHPREVVRAADQRLAEAYMQVDEEVVRLHKARSGGKGATPGYAYSTRLFRELRIVCDGPPGPEAGRFVEVEDMSGRSVNAGEWRERTDGLWELVIVVPAAKNSGKEPQN